LMDDKVVRVVSVIKKRLPDVRVILFGSRARGDHLADSDIDLILVSRTFEGIHFTDRASLILKALYEEDVRTGVDVELFCYTPEEFEGKRVEFGLVKEALREGIEL
jgi:predicted nucleotidyltransferase